MHRLSRVAPQIAIAILVACVARTTLAEAPKAETLDALIPKIAKFEHGQDAANLGKVAELVAQSHADPARREQVAVKLAALLGTDATFAAKQFVCRQLWRIGSARAVPPLARLLTGKDTANMARYALERMPVPEAGCALRDALGKTTGAVKVGVINSLGERREYLAVSDLAGLVGDGDRAIAQAAILALAKIGGDVAMAALLDAKAKAQPDGVATVDEALLLCADGLVAAGEGHKAETIYIALYWRQQLPQTRAAALKGLLAVDERAYTPLAVASLSSAEPILAGAAAAAVRELAGPDATALIVNALPRMAPAAKALALYALADRGDRAARPAVIAATSDPDEAVRAAAASALDKLGGKAP